MVLKGLPFARVYIDDIVVFSKVETSHAQHLYEVFQRLHDYGLCVNRKKCQFFQKEIIYLGSRISANGVKPDMDRIQPLLDFPSPSTKKKVQEFLGMVNFYRDYIPQLAHHA